jgi:hypothetical protein
VYFYIPISITIFANIGWSQEFVPLQSQCVSCYAHNGYCQLEVHKGGMILVGSSSEERGTNVIGCVDFLNELPGSSEELFVDLIFNGKSRVRVPSEMLISNQLDFQGQEILLRC